MELKNQIYFDVRDAFLTSQSVKELKAKLNEIFTPEVIAESDRLNAEYQYKGELP